MSIKLVEDYDMKTLEEIKSVKIDTFLLINFLNFLIFLIFLNICKIKFK